MVRKKPIPVIKRMLYKARERAALHEVPFEITVADIQIPTHCPALGIPLVVSRGALWTDNSPSLDRIVPERGYVPGNVVVISMRANRIKCNANPTELLRLAKFVAAHWPDELRWQF